MKWNKSSTEPKTVEKLNIPSKMNQKSLFTCRNSLNQSQEPLEKAVFSPGTWKHIVARQGKADQIPPGRAFIKIGATTEEALVIVDL